MSIFSPSKTADRIIELLKTIIILLKDILKKLSLPPSAPKGRLEVNAVYEIPIRRPSMPILTGNHFYDRAGLHVAVAPNGTLDAPPTVTFDPPDLLTVVPAADGLSADVFADTDVAAFTVTFTAPADNPSTPELENVSQSFTGSFSHSKATELVGTFSEIPRV